MKTVIGDQWPVVSKKLTNPLRAGAVLLFVAATVFAQGVTFEAQVDRTTVTMNDTLTLELIISGGKINVTQPALPPIPGFKAYGAGQSQNYSFVNGQVSSQVVFTYALAPQSPGEYTIPSLSIQAGGETLSTKPISVKVVSGGAPPGAAGGAAASAAPGETEAPAAGEADLFLVSVADKKTVFVGEPLTLSVRFYSRAHLSSQPAYAAPDTQGFLVEDLPPQRQYTDFHNGRRYAVVELKSALIPTSPGKMTVGPAALECRVQDFSRDQFGGSFFDDFFAGGKPVTLRSAPLNITVAPLPEAGRPAQFKGDVGRYAIAVTLDKQETKTHEPVTLSVVISGEGNIKGVSTPVLPALEGFRTYETLSSMNVSKSHYRLQGSKVFKTILKPDVSGKLTIPSISFSFFDPEARAYKTVQSSPLAITVTPSAVRDDSPPAPSPAISEGLKVVGQDIRFIKSGGGLKARRPDFRRTRIFAALNLLPLFGFLSALLFQFVRGRREANPAAYAARRAIGRALRGLKHARGAQTRGNLAESYDHMQNALKNYLGDKIGASSQGLLWDTAEERLRGRAVKEEVIMEVKLLWDDFDLARFSSASVNDTGARDHLRRLEAALKRLNAGWKP